MKIYIDESGNTGSDYLNLEQPNFIISVHWIPADAWETAMAEIFKQHKADELKFKTLSRGKRYEQMIDFINFLNTQKDNFCSYIVHKQSILIEKFVHDCIEPAFWSDGIDLSEKGGIRAYANLLNIVMPSEMGREWYTQLLTLYNKFIRKKDHQSFADLVNHSFSAGKMTKELLSPFLHKLEKAYAEVNKDCYRADMYHVLVSGLLTNLRSSFGITNFELVCDQLKSIKDHELHEFTSFLELFTDEIEVSSICRIYPDVKINKVEFADSKEDVLIQLSDLIAGITNFSLLPKNLESTVSKAYCDMIDDRNLIHKICSTDITPKDLGMEKSPGLIREFIKTSMG